MTTPPEPRPPVTIEADSDLPFSYPPAPANPAAPKPKCVRHVWSRTALSTGEVECIRCSTIRDEAAVRRNRANAARGKRIQRQRIVGLGGQNLPGNKPNHDGIGLAFSYESKSGPAAFSERAWRWLVGIPAMANQTRVLIVTDAPGKGNRARSYVVVEYDEWRDLHGETA